VFHAELHMWSERKNLLGKQSSHSVRLYMTFARLQTRIQHAFLLMQTRRLTCLMTSIDSRRQIKLIGALLIQVISGSVVILGLKKRGAGGIAGPRKN